MSEQTVGNPIGKAVALIVLCGAGWWFFQNYQILGLDGIEVQPRAGEAAELDGRVAAAMGSPARDSSYGTASRQALLAGNQGIPSTLASVRDFTPTEVESVATENGSAGDFNPREFGAIRVGTWALAGFDRYKLAKPHVMEWFSNVVRELDVVALQQLSGKERDLLPRMVEHINRTGRKYDFIIGPSVGPNQRTDRLDTGVLNEHYAFIFDTERIETDRGQVYTLNDPEDTITYDPLVAWFRVRGVPQKRAWTFSITNFRVDSERAVLEIPLIGKIMAAVASDGRSEDDLILAGMFCTDDRDLAKYLGGDVCRPAVTGTPTDIFARYQLSNIISPKSTTTESLEHGGVLNFAKIFDLSLSEAEELSPHLPVFAEFTPTEGN